MREVGIQSIDGLELSLSSQKDDLVSVEGKDRQPTRNKGGGSRLVTWHNADNSVLFFTSALRHFRSLDYLSYVR